MLFLIGLLQLLSLHLVPHPRSSLKCNKKSKVLPQGEKKIEFEWHWCLLVQPYAWRCSHSNFIELSKQFNTHGLAFDLTYFIRSLTARDNNRGNTRLPPCQMNHFKQNNQWDRNHLLKYTCNRWLTTETEKNIAIRSTELFPQCLPQNLQMNHNCFQSFSTRF